jgi:NADPH:quinone reductase-like Zn-dependent oxidoreductase
MRSIGAEHVIDYTQEDFTKAGPRYDVILDNVASHSLSETRRALKPDGLLLPSSGNAGMGWIMAAAFSAMVLRQQGAPFVAKTDTATLDELRDLIETDRVTPLIDRTYPLRETARAFAYLDEGHARGKVVIAVEEAA